MVVALFVDGNPAAASRRLFFRDVILHYNFVYIFR